MFELIKRECWKQKLKALPIFSALHIKPIVELLETWFMDLNIDVEQFVTQVNLDQNYDNRFWELKKENVENANIQDNSSLTN